MAESTGMASFQQQSPTQSQWGNKEEFCTPSKIGLCLFKNVPGPKDFQTLTCFMAMFSRNIDRLVMLFLLHWAKPLVTAFWQLLQAKPGPRLKQLNKNIFDFMIRMYWLLLCKRTFLILFVKN